jgi:ATP-dependent Clp protease ATP-binding subunit ClpC
VVDFRRCVIVLTSNIGSPLARGPSVGFEPSARTFSSAGIERAIQSSFRPEFRNRLDGIVVFRPFERSAMRALLDKELADALARRGLRGRPWAVEVDDSAYAFLIDKGSARARRPAAEAGARAIPARALAAAIVEQSVPEGDQFLFVTAAEATASRSPSSTRTPSRARGAREPRRSTCEVARGARGRGVRSLRPRRARTGGGRRGGLQVRKGTRCPSSRSRVLGARTASSSSPGRVPRSLRSGRSTAERLGTRLERSTRPGGDANAELVELLANRLYVLDRAVAGIAADSPTDVYVHLRASGSDRGAEAEPFAALLAEMYVGWARKRGMHLERLDAPSGEHLLAVSGLGCGEILGGEAGLHVLEQVVGSGRDGDRVVDREQVRVQIVALAPGPAAGSVEVTRGALAAADEAGAPAHIVRRYRPGRAPLVRDSGRGYRTGRLDRILAGDFDLY